MWVHSRWYEQNLHCLFFCLLTFCNIFIFILFLYLHLCSLCPPLPSPPIPFSPTHTITTLLSMSTSYIFNENRLIFNENTKFIFLIKRINLLESCNVTWNCFWFWLRPPSHFLHDVAMILWPNNLVTCGNQSYEVTSLKFRGLCLFITNL